MSDSLKSHVGDNQWSISQLSEITGLDRATISKRLKGVPVVEGPKRAKLYKGLDAFPRLYHVSDDKETKKQLLEAELALKEAQAKKTQIEAERAAKEVVPITDVCKVVETEYTYVRASLRAIPARKAKELSMVSDPVEVSEILEQEISEALAYLTADSQYENIANERVTDQQSETEIAGDTSENSETSAETESSGVGGSVQVSIS